MGEKELAVEQAVVIRTGGSPRLVARSADVDFAAEEAVLRIAVKFGPRPPGVVCPATTFATPIDAGRVAVARAVDRGEGGDPPLVFHFLLLTRTLYRELGDPFAVADRYPANFDARGSLPQLAWPLEPLPRRKVEDLHDILEHRDSQFLLGATQALLDGAHVAVTRDTPDLDRVRGLWQLLPDRIRFDLWPATFAFAGDLNFHLAVCPLPVPGHLSEEQCKDYPEGRYEASIQAAVESLDQRELDRLLARRPSAEVLRLALGMVAFAFLVAAVLKFF